jgi:hypothetical protein
VRYVRRALKRRHPDAFDGVRVEPLVRAADGEWFCALEAPDGSPEADAARGHRTEDVYKELRQALLDAVELLAEDRVFCGDPRRQLPASLYYGGRGVLRPVTDLRSALGALALLIDQTCGRDGVDPGAGDEPPADSHYRRFRGLLGGTDFAEGDWTAPTGAPTRVDRSAVWRFDGEWSNDPEVRAAQEAFHREWHGLTDGLVAVLRGDHGRFPILARRMCTLGPEAVRLMRLPGNTPGMGADPVFRGTEEHGLARLLDSRYQRSWDCCAWPADLLQPLPKPFSPARTEVRIFMGTSLVDGSSASRVAPSTYPAPGRLPP